MRSNEETSKMPALALICGLAGGVWSLVGGFVIFADIITGAGLVPVFFVLECFLIMLMGLLSMIAMTIYSKKPRLATTMMWISFAGIILAFPLYPRPNILSLFLSPAPVFLVIAAITLTLRLRNRPKKELASYEK